MWDERYSDKEYVYGTEANAFLSSQYSHIPMGKVLCVAEGEGRNAVFLAEQGYQVLGVDSSAVGLAKAQQLANERKVTIQTEVADLAEFEIEAESLEGIVSIFCHLPPPIRRSLYGKIQRGLKPGGVLVLEAYTPAQLEYGTGGPPVVELMTDLAELQEEFSTLEFVHALELTREVVEGKYHTGTGAVVQLVARKPSPRKYIGPSRFAGAYVLL